MAFWHGRVLTATYFFRRRGIVVMISENFDGEWIARIIEQFGFRTSRGSSSRGGQRALLKLKREMERGRPSGFAVDGPRGPARKAQPGAVWLAKLTGNPVVPFHMEASSYWSLKSWDRTQIPRAVLDGGAGCWNADRRAGGCGRSDARSQARRTRTGVIRVGAKSGGDARAMNGPSTPGRCPSQRRTPCCICSSDIFAGVPRPAASHRRHPRTIQTLRA